MVNMCQVTAKLAGKNLTVVIDTEEDRKAAAYKAFNPTNKFPLLETPEGNLSESQAIAKFLAHGHATLLGANAVERAQVDQWMNWLQSGVMQQAGQAIYAIFGKNPDCTQPMFNEACQGIKQNLRAVDSALTGDWLVGNNVTLADIFLAGAFSLPFQLILDVGFTKAAAKACAWFTRVSALPEFIAIFGKIKMAKKAVKPVLKTEEKPKKAAAAAAAP
jgi:elongation factor 1-gamma